MGDASMLFLTCLNLTGSESNYLISWICDTSVESEDCKDLEALETSWISLETLKLIFNTWEEFRLRDLMSIWNGPKKWHANARAEP